MLPEQALQKISGIINSVLSKDPDYLSVLSSLEGKCLAISVQGLSVLLYIKIDQGAIQLLNQSHVNDEKFEPNVTIEGPPFALLSLLFSRDAMQTMQDSGIKIQGDLHVARQLSDTLSQLDVDWEGILAEYIGDIPAQKIGSGLQKVIEWRSRVHESWQAALTEYLQEESRSLPTRIEVEHFLNQVDSVRDAVERLEARIKQLT